MSQSSQPIEISSDEGSSYEDLPTVTRKPTIAQIAKERRKSEAVSTDATLSSRLHSESYHDVNELVTCQQDLLNWFENEKLKRGMPWRRPFDPSRSMEEQGQHAYEVWVSEVMLQQTQVATVIEYWKRWMKFWPTIADLAKADVEEVNSAWKGLGYYRRARSLLSGAQKVVSTPAFKGRLPNEPETLEKEVDGVGRYTAGAICSIAYGIRTPIVDGNIHRLLTRTLGIHAPQAGGPTIRKLWQSADQLVNTLPERHGVAGDWNQALMELGSTVCKPVNPSCDTCPLRSACNAYKEMALRDAPKAEEDACELCVDIPSDMPPSVTIFPMKKAKAAQREEQTAVCVLEWRPPGGEAADAKWLLVKRPEKGLLAGLFEPPSILVPLDASAVDRSEACAGLLGTLLEGELERVSHRDVGEVKHVFSHILMSYQIEHVVVGGQGEPRPRTTEAGAPQMAWLTSIEVEQANIGTGVKKIWAAVYPASGPGSQSKKRKAAAVKEPSGPDGKRVLKVVMPGMPVRKVL